MTSTKTPPSCPSEHKAVFTWCQNAKVACYPSCRQGCRRSVASLSKELSFIPLLLTPSTSRCGLRCSAPQGEAGHRYNCPFWWSACNKILPWRSRVKLRCSPTQSLSIAVSASPRNRAV